MSVALCRSGDALMCDYSDFLKITSLCVWHRPIAYLCPNLGVP